jgi:branched-subunit amino acid ABC-type transport system permease component
MEQLIQQTAAGLANGAIYALLALALVMIFVSTDHINFAQGNMAMFSAYLSWQLLQWGLNFWIVLPIVMALSFLIGVSIERIILRPLHSAPLLSVVVVFIGLLTIFYAAIQRKEMAHADAAARAERQPFELRFLIQGGRSAVDRSLRFDRHISHRQPADLHAGVEIALDQCR